MPATKGATAGAVDGRGFRVCELSLRREIRVNRGFECETRTRPIPSGSVGAEEEGSRGESGSTTLAVTGRSPGQSRAVPAVLPFAGRCSWLIFFLDWKIRTPRPGRTLLTNRGLRGGATRSEVEASR